LIVNPPSVGNHACVELIRTMREMTAAATALRPVALVPTMGALHEGHATLMRRARESGRAVVASIYVNPTQFGPKEDFTKYPRTLEADCALCEEAGVSVVFAPADMEMYPDGPSAPSTWVDELQVARRLEGERRPGHFRGVCTVVAKLFNIVRPDAAFFGQKDYQQLKVIERMVRDLRYPIEIVPVPTVREADGLAMSSRNRYLAPADRARAIVLSHALEAACKLFRQGQTDPIQLEAEMKKLIATIPEARLDYAEVVDGQTLERIPIACLGDVALIAAYLGTTRLIDNHVL
jgi:pantoate--beta-alanine ligase